jgi:malate synthase
MSTAYKSVNDLKVSEDLLLFVNNELLKDTDISPEKFWLGFDEAVHNLATTNKELIKTRENLQKKIDDWHIKNRGNQIKTEEYKQFLKEIGYLQDEGSDFEIETDKVDDEIKKNSRPTTRSTNNECTLYP